jgi:hypothetical protein
MSHDEHPTADVFSFREDRHTGVFTCKRVVEGAPILHVAHDEDGDWQFLCGGDHEEEGEDEGKLICLEHLVAGDPSLNQLADMCRHSRAERSDREQDWVIIDEVEAFILHHVKVTGWSVQGVEAASEDEPAFAYTVGLYENYRQPEVIVFGLDVTLMQEILNDCGRRVKAGHGLPLDAPFPDVLEDHDVRFRVVRGKESYDKHLGYAIWFYRGHDFPVVQLVWPTRSGQWPDDPAAPEFLHKLQPLLP